MTSKQGRHPAVRAAVIRGVRRTPLYECMTGSCEKRRRTNLTVHTHWPSRKLCSVCGRNMQKPGAQDVQTARAHIEELLLRVVIREEFGPHAQE